MLVALIYRYSGRDTSDISEFLLQARRTIAVRPVKYYLILG
jgi:hypothetical protein